MSSSSVEAWQASPARGLSKPADSKWSCWKRASCWAAECTASTWTASTWSSAPQWVHDDAASHPARNFVSAPTPAAWNVVEQAALVCRGERRPGAEIKRARAAAERAFGAARATRRRRKPTLRWTTRSGRCSRAPTVTQFFVRLENELDYGAGAEALPASLG